MALPLLVVEDETLLDEVLRLAAAAGCETEVVAAGAAVPARWSAAPLVIVGEDQLGPCVRAALPRRQGVLVLSRSEPSAQVWQQAVGLGAEQVLVLPSCEASLIERLGRAEDMPVRRGRVLCCIGGRGGAGASVLAAALAVTAAREGPTLLVDLDPYSGGIDLALGGEQVEGLRWPDLGRTSGRLSAQALSEALPRLGGAAVLATARGHAEEIDAESTRAVIGSASAAGQRVIVDLPRQLTPAAREAVGAADRVLLVVPAEVRACVAASATAQRLSRLTDRMQLVVRAVSGSGLTPQAICSTLGLPLAGALRSQPGLTAALDRGEFPMRRLRGSLATVCRALLEDPVEAAA